MKKKPEVVDLLLFWRTFFGHSDLIIDESETAALCGPKEGKLLAMQLIYCVLIGTFRENRIWHREYLNSNPFEINLD